ncbi:alpha/beta fold hydrolase [Streptomyces sp. TRM 70351]|uniref:alpha/beta fold hydrolase n=1 Tax=Streptomyces sp. TRM 70351 TaxID=3116552 RepID=UPI002E7B2BFD|nr:alpha/beta fold hydrolase [Streptomyces sp. TRM 70351]MEE1930319.1 alpha/beta fold hydrolase [Streptomyces sp. TRM 70351]
MTTFTASDGVEIAYRLWGWERRSALPAVVLHHGYAADSRINWVDPGIVEALTAAGRRVVTLDARGHGASGKPHDPARYGEGRMAEDVVALVDLLGEERYDLAGYSMGAIVALLTAARDGRVRRLVVAGVGAGVVERGGVDTRATGGRELLHALETDDPSSVTNEDAAAFRAFADATGADREALVAQARAVHTGGVPFADVRAAALVMAGEEDRLAVRPGVLADALPQAVLRTVPGDHLSAVVHPDFTRELVAFVGAP